MEGHIIAGNMIILVLLCIQGIVPVYTNDCPQEYEVLSKTAGLYAEWASNQVNNNIALHSSEIPLIEGNNSWVFTTNRNEVTINLPTNRNTSVYLYKVNSIIIQTWNNNNNNVTCSNLGSLNLFNIRVRLSVGYNRVTYRLPNSVYHLTGQELILKIPFNEFTADEVQVLLYNIEEGQNICLRFGFVGTIVTDATIIGYEITIADTKLLPDYVIRGMVCDLAYNICSGGVSFFSGKNESNIQPMMRDPMNFLTWECTEQQMCHISIKLIIDYSVLIGMMVISGVIDVNKYLPLIQTSGDEECEPGETSFGGQFSQHQLYRDSFTIELKKETNILSFNICLHRGEEAVIYNIDIYDVHGNKILVQENCEEGETQEVMTSQMPAVVVVVTLLAVLLTTILSIVIVYLARKTVKQQNLISSLSKPSKLSPLQLPLIPKNYCFQDTEIYDSIDSHVQPMEQSSMSQVHFIENQTLYGKRVASNRDTNKVYANNKVNSSDSFSEYNNLKHL